MLRPIWTMFARPCVCVVFEGERTEKRFPRYQNKAQQWGEKEKRNQEHGINAFIDVNVMVFAYDPLYI